MSNGGKTAWTIAPFKGRRQITMWPRLIVPNPELAMDGVLTLPAQMDLLPAKGGVMPRWIEYHGE